MSIWLTLMANVWLYTFKPTAPLNWIAGQFIRVELPHDLPDDEGTKRQFTIASAPSDGTIQIATRLTSSTFKQALHSLPAGGQINLVDLPAGDFIWPADHTRALVLAAQGIGITPIRSLFRQRLHEGRPLTATLIYANLTPGIPFEDELTQWGSHPEFSYKLVETPITGQIIAQLVPKLAKAHIYVSGPEPLFELLGPPHNLPAGYLKQDQFPNYAAHYY
jgi:ferredoxin-NADP reductase